MKMLLATDGSKHAEDAARLLAHLPHSEPIELTVLSVNYMYEIHGSVEIVGWMDWNFAEEKAKSAAACQRIERMFAGTNARIESVVVEGHPGETIVQEAQARGIDLIVIGAVGHSTFDRILMGSVSDFVATHARCSVLVVRPHDPHPPEQPAINICVAYDHSGPCRNAIKELIAFDWSQNTKIDVVSVMTLPYMYSEMPIEIDTQVIKSATMKTLEDGATSLRLISANVNSELIESNHVGDAIVQFATKMDSDIIVMGNSGRGLISRFLIGSASRYVLRHAPCSVWIARSQTE